MGKIYAKDFKCIRCGKQAELFLGISDPDMPKRPYCKKCAEKLQIEIFTQTM